MKSGDARVALIGFPSVGKVCILQLPSSSSFPPPPPSLPPPISFSDLQSTLLNKFTTTHSESAGYEFTTLTCIPGVIEVWDSHVQALT